MSITSMMKDEDLQYFANQVKEVLLLSLTEEGTIPNGRELAEKYAIIINRPGFLGKIWDKIRGIDPEGTDLRISVVKSVSLTYKNEKEDS